MRRARECPTSSPHEKGFFVAPNRRKNVMEKSEGYMKALRCRECGREYPLTATHVCEFDFGPLEVAYDYDRIRSALTHEVIQSRPRSMWRYRELLPVANGPTVGLQVGFTPLVRAFARRSARTSGVKPTCKPTVGPLATG